MRMKLASALIAALLVFGMVFGVGQAAAASLPGGPLYGLKLTAEQARVGLTSSPEAKAELAAELAENRFDEIGRMMAAGKTVDGATAHKAQQQLSLAYQYMRQVDGEQQLQARHRLTNMLQNQYRVMAGEVNGVSDQQQEPVGTLLRSMKRVRAELHTGEGEASDEPNRNNREEEPIPQGPVGEPGSGPHAGQDDGLLDATGETGSGGQGQGQGGQGAGQGQGPNAQPESPVGPKTEGDANYGPGPELPLRQQDSGTYKGDGPAYSHGPGSEEPPRNSDAPAGFQWLWRLFQKEPQSGSGTSGNGTSDGGKQGGKP